MTVSSLPDCAPCTAARKVYLFDTTLRDGAQTSGVDFSAADKQRLAHVLDDFGMHYVEGGWPGANDTDNLFFENAPRLAHARLTAFGMTRRVGRSASNDEGLSLVLNSPAPAVCLVGKTWDAHVTEALKTTLDDNLQGIRESVARAKNCGKEVVYDLEHFFDAWKTNRAYTLACMRAALENGARWLVMCDTNGGTFPHEIRAIVADVMAEGIEGRVLGIHTHNDMGCADANTLEAVMLGVEMVQGTLNGLGERSGNANLVTLIPMLVKLGFDCGVDAGKLVNLKTLSRTLDDVLDRQPNSRLPFVGDDAFTHKGGLHGSAVAKNPALYEHIDPALVGNKRRLPMSNQGGLANLEARLTDFGISYDRADPKLRELVADVKEMESKGYSFDLADASFELLVRAKLGGLPQFFEVESVCSRTTLYPQKTAGAELPEATVKLAVQGRRVICTAEGNGPVNAIDNALRQALEGQYPALSGMKLSDYKVRILANAQATGAVTCVRITSKGTGTQGEGLEWSTVAASTNIMDASAMALIDAYNWYLLKTCANGARAHAAQKTTDDTGKGLLEGHFVKAA